MEENKALLNDKQTLKTENDELRGIIAESLLMNDGRTKSCSTGGDGVGCGSAVPSVSLPQEHTLPLLFQMYMIIRYNLFHMSICSVAAGNSPYTHTFVHYSGLQQLKGYY